MGNKKYHFFVFRLTFLRKIANFARKMDISLHILDDFRRGRIETFYRELYPSLLRYAERTLGAEHAYQAEDCVQEAVYKVYLRRHQFQDADAMKSYLFICLHNEIVSLFRKADIHARYLERRPEPDDDTFFDNMVLQETLDRIYEAVDRLPERLRSVFDMSFEQGLKNTEIAQQLSLSPETIKKRKASLLEMLRNALRGGKLR